MMYLTILDALYIVLILFSSIIGTLIILVLIRVFRALGPVMELVDIYNKIREIAMMYKHIPDLIKDKVETIIKKD